jgi:hypothetical protein
LWIRTRADRTFLGFEIRKLDLQSSDPRFKSLDVLLVTTR